MTEDIFVELITQSLGLLLEAAIALWQEILLWMYATLLLWVQTDMIPLMEESVRLAFMSAAIITASLLKEIKAAWQEVRRFLLEAFVEFEKSPHTADKWVKRISAVVIKAVENTRPVVVKREAEEEVNWDDLPAEVRSAWLNRNHTSQKN